MRSNGNDFLQRLLETFKLEAEEHLQNISSGLLDLEKSQTACDRTPVVEVIFREAHSLKGAARAVNKVEIEAMCQSLESVFSAMKRERLAPSPEVFDTLHQTLDTIRLLLGSENGQAIHHQQQAVSLSQKLMLLESNATTPTPAIEPQNQAADEVKEALSGNAAKVEEGKRHDRKPVSEAPVQPKPQLREVAPSIAPSSTTVRIASAKLDSLLLEAEELVSVKLTMSHLASELRSAMGMFETWNKQWAKIDPELRAARQTREKKRAGAQANRPDSQQPRLLEFLDWSRAHIRSLEATVASLEASAQQEGRALGAMVDNLLEDMKKTLMLPSSLLFGILPKLVRDLSRDQGKEVEIEISGADIEIDRRILEEIKDPLIHIIRNSIDHGVEKPDQRQQRGKPRAASLKVSASQTHGNKVELLISDDGAGIDVERVRQAAVARGMISKDEADRLDERDAVALIFKSEVSTSPIITDLSGRGLGLAIVKEKIEKIGGLVSVESAPGSGTVFRLLLPLTISTFRGILVRASDGLFVVPAASVERVARVRRSEIKTVETRETVVLNGRVVSLARLADVLGLPQKGPGEGETDFLPVLVLGSGEKRIAFAVDEVLREQEVLIKGLGRQLARVRNIAGATVLGSGRVVPVLSVSDLLKSAARARAVSKPALTKEKPAAKRKSILIAEDSITSRMLLKNIIESAGYQVKTAVDGVDALTCLKSESFDLIVSDIEMPRMNGLDLTAKIRGDRLLAGTPVVLVTSLGSREDRERGIDVGANAYIVKGDFDQSNLLEVIGRLV